VSDKWGCALNYSAVSVPLELTSAYIKLFPFFPFSFLCSFMFRSTFMNQALSPALFLETMVWVPEEGFFSFWVIEVLLLGCVGVPCGTMATRTQVRDVSFSS